jgi:hypothetical protein
MGHMPDVTSQRTLGAFGRNRQLPRSSAQVAVADGAE